MRHAPPQEAASSGKQYPCYFVFDVGISLASRSCTPHRSFASPTPGLGDETLEPTDSHSERGGGLRSSADHGNVFICIFWESCLECWQSLAERTRWDPKKQIRFAARCLLQQPPSEVDSSTFSVCRHKSQKVAALHGPACDIVQGSRSTLRP